MAKQKKSKYLESFADPKALFESFIIPLINIETEEEAAQFVIDTT